MVLLEDWYRRGGPVGAMLGFLFGGVALGPVAYVYGRLAERIPEAGSEVAYTAAVFPRAVSFAAVAVRYTDARSPTSLTRPAMFAGGGITVSGFRPRFTAGRRCP